MAIALFIGLGLCVVLVTRYVLCAGIERLADHLGLSPKAKGQILGYSTSVPELAGTVSTAATGLLEAGLWNVASSNIINLVLFLAANIFYRQYRELPKTKFLDEIGFSLGAIAILLVLSVGGRAGRSPWTALALFGYFAAYIVVDWKVNRPTSAEAENRNKSAKEYSGLHLARAIALILAGVAGIVVLGRYLGVTARLVVSELGLSQAVVGWILGVATSLPEMTSFFAIYAFAKATGHLDEDVDTQEALDNLTASNMSNLGLIYPLGIIVYLLATQL